MSDQPRPTDRPAGPASSAGPAGVPALLGVACALVLAPLAPGAAPLAAQATPAADGAVAGRSAAFRRAADAFVAAAATGDAARAEGMISANMLQRSGREAVRRVLATQVLPFFAGWGATGRSANASETTDAFGSHGYAFYLWMEPRDGGAARPFVLYVVDEGGQPVIANVAVDRKVDGRHR
jgi:hypothetical protein